MQLITGKKFKEYANTKLSKLERDLVARQPVDGNVSLEELYESNKLEVIKIGDFFFNPFDYTYNSGAKTYRIEVTIPSGNATLLKYNPIKNKLMIRTIDFNNLVSVHFNFFKSDPDSLVGEVVKRVEGFKEHVLKLNEEIEQFNEQLKTLVYEKLPVKLEQKKLISEKLAAFNIKVQ